MGQTIVEKIISLHSNEEVRAGKIVWMDIDLRTARDFGGANVVKNFEKEYKDSPVGDNAKTFFTFDCVVPANNIPYANNQQICRIFAQEQGIKVYDVDAGIGSHVMIEEGFCYPLVTIVGTDSHLNLVGAIGAFGQGMGDQDIAFAFKTGKTWFEVPETMKIKINGDLKFPASAKDLTLAILQKLGASGALGKVIEFYGPAIDNLSLDGRITLASMVTEMGGIIGFMPLNENVLDYLKARANKPDIVPIYAGPDANYCEEIVIDINGLTPLVSAPPKPDNVKAVYELKDVKINSAFIGSCTNGRFEDFETVANIIKGHKVAKGVMAKAVPATKEVYRELLKKGILEILFDSGVIICNPGCGGCASGQVGITGEHEVQISTSNRNFIGKQGAGLTYLASPATVAMSMLDGRISCV